VAPPLEVEADAAGATADVEHPAADRAHRTSFDRRPAAERPEVGLGTSGQLDIAVVALDDLRIGAAMEVLPDLPAERILAVAGVCHRYSLSYWISE
jgi:hypothetical protein